jgi:iron complex transport system ATP-binding protein
VLELAGVSYRVGRFSILQDVSARFEPRCFNVVIGPNGAGKSTLLKVATGLLKPSSGDVRYDDHSIVGISPESLARTRAVLSQHVELAFDLSVEDVVMMGRYPHFRHGPAAVDRRIVADAIGLAGVVNSPTQVYGTLSGGERQKVHMARVLAQVWNDDAGGSHKILFLDEPTLNLDVRHQLHILTIMRTMLARNCTVVAVLHDLNIALEYGDRFLLLDRGRVVLEAERATDIPRDAIERAFQVRTLDPVDTKQPYWRFAI